MKIAPENPPAFLVYAMAIRCMSLTFYAVLLLSPCLLSAADSLLDASRSLHPFDISVQLPPSSQLLFYSISLATALAPGELPADAIRRSVAHPSLSAPVVLCSSSINATSDASNSSASNSSSDVNSFISSARASTCVFSSNLSAGLESLLLRAPASSGLLCVPPAFTACVKAFHAVANFTFNTQRCSAMSCSAELQSFRSNYNVTAASTDTCESLVISLPPIVLAASFGRQTVVMPSLVPAGNPTPLLNQTFTAAASAGADLKLLLLISPLASNFSMAPVNQPPPPCRYSSMSSLASHAGVVVSNSSTWMLSPVSEAPPAPGVPLLYDASSSLGALLLSSPLVARLVVITLTIKPCLFAPVSNQPFCVVPHVVQPAAASTAAIQRDARFTYSFSQQLNQSTMTVSTPFICASYTLPLPRPRWLSIGPDMSRAHASAADVLSPTQFPTAVQRRAAAAVVAAAAADVVAFRERLECGVWRMLLSQSNPAASATTEPPCPPVPDSMQPGLQLVLTAAECRVLIPFNATSDTTGFNASLSFLRSPSAQRFNFYTSAGSPVDDDAAQHTATGERVEVQAEARFTYRDVGAVIPLCAVLWTAAASPSDVPVFNASMTRMHCVLVLVRPCLVCGRRSIAYTASTLWPRTPTQLLMALNLNTVRSIPPLPPGFSVAPPLVSRVQRPSLLLPELQRTHVFNMPDGHLLQTGIAHTIVDGDSLAFVASTLQSDLPLLAAANPGLPANASVAGGGGGDYELIQGAMLCVLPLSNSKTQDASLV